jgi:phage baseplate assembly protein W
MMIILVTDLGERIMRPDFGRGIHDLSPSRARTS